MKKPRVSVVCIFFNEERYLTEAVESVLAQEFDDFELLLVDDGSTDTSSRIARDYAEAHSAKIVYLEHPGHANRGMSAARNLGFRHASGEYLAIMDGDDRWYPHKLREQVAILDADPSIGMACGGYRDLLTGRPERGEWFLSGHMADRPSYPPETTLRLYPLGWACSPKDPLVRREIALRVGGYEDNFPGLDEDQVFLAKIYLETGVVFSRSVWLDYRRHEDSCTARITWDDYLTTRGRFLDWFEAYLDRRAAVGADPIRRAIGRARRGLRHRLMVRVTRRLRRLGLHTLRLVGFEERYRRDSSTA